MPNLNDTQRIIVLFDSLAKGPSVQGDDDPRVRFAEVTMRGGAINVSQPVQAA